MKYYLNPQDGETYGYDENTHKNLIDAAVAAAWAIQAGPPGLPAISLKAQAQAALDVVTGPRGQVIRCVAAGVAVPAAWTQYVQNLRAIINGTNATASALPAIPAYVAGT